MNKTSKYALGLFLSLPLFLFVVYANLSISTAFIAFVYFWLGLMVGEQNEEKYNG